MTRSNAQLVDVLRAARVDAEVFALRPDYRVVLVAVDGITPAPSDATSDDLLRAAEEGARALLADRPVDEVPHVAAWREAYRTFGATPQRTRNSLEALLRRAGAGLPRVNRLTDVYNAVSVAHLVPLGGEDLDHYVGAARLTRATGHETFVGTADGQDVVEHPDAGEVVWRDDEGVTCRRWNWRQTARTRLRDDTTAALFVLDALAPLGDGALRAAADALVEHLAGASPHLVAAQRMISAADPPA